MPGPLHPVGFWSTSDPFVPVIYGRIASNGDTVYSFGSDDAIAPSTATGEGYTGVWLYMTSDNCYVRVGCHAVGGLSTTEQWYNTGGTSQGDPGPETGTGTNVFELGTQPSEVRITNTDTDVAGAPVYSVLGSSYTSGSFFTPSVDTKYGRRVWALATRSTLGITQEQGYIDLQFTFRKPGETDYTVTFRGRAQGRAFVEV